MNMAEEGKSWRPEGWENFTKQMLDEDGWDYVSEVHIERVADAMLEALRKVASDQMELIMFGNRVVVSKQKNKE